MKQVKQKAPEVEIPMHTIKVAGITFEHYPDRVVARADSGHLEVHAECTPEDLLNYTRQALRYYRLRGEFKMSREWAGACERALAAVAHKLGVLDKNVAREVYGLCEGMEDQAVDFFDAGKGEEDEGVVKNWLEAIRKEKGLTMKAVAESVGISQPAYFNIEKGLRGLSVATAKKIAEVLDFEWTRFFEEQENKPA